MNLPLGVYGHVGVCIFSSWRTFKLFLFMNKAAINICIQGFILFPWALNKFFLPRKWYPFTSLLDFFLLFFWLIIHTLPFPLFSLRGMFGEVLELLNWSSFLFFPTLNSLSFLLLDRLPWLYFLIFLLKCIHFSIVLIQKNFIILSF